MAPAPTFEGACFSLDVGTMCSSGVSVLAYEIVNPVAGSGLTVSTLGVISGILTAADYQYARAGGYTLIYAAIDSKGSRFEASINFFVSAATAPPMLLSECAGEITELGGKSLDLNVGETIALDVSVCVTATDKFRYYLVTIPPLPTDTDITLSPITGMLTGTLSVFDAQATPAGYQFNFIVENGAGGTLTLNRAATIATPIVPTLVTGVNTTVALICSTFVPSSQNNVGAMITSNPDAGIINSFRISGRGFPRNSGLSLTKTGFLQGTPNNFDVAGSSDGSYIVDIEVYSDQITIGYSYTFALRVFAEGLELPRVTSIIPTLFGPLDELFTLVDLAAHFSANGMPTYKIVTKPIAMASIFIRSTELKSFFTRADYVTNPNGIMVQVEVDNTDTSTSRCGGGKTTTTFRVMIDPDAHPPIVLGKHENMVWCEKEKAKQIDFSPYFFDPKGLLLTYSFAALQVCKPY
jgi:hypothetical protein